MSKNKRGVVMASEIEKAAVEFDAELANEHEDHEHNEYWVCEEHGSPSASFIRGATHLLDRCREMAVERLRIHEPFKGTQTEMVKTVDLSDIERLFDEKEEPHEQKDK